MAPSDRPEPSSDAVAEALPEDDLDSRVLFHRAVLGLEPETTWLLPDPYGLLRSRAVSNADVAVRFGLDDALVDGMQSFGILYDRAGEAEFFHLYGTPFQNRFFFEVVSRKGGYDLYGAANAPARMAALAEPRRRGDIVEYL